MRLGGAQFTNRCLMGVVAITAALVGGVFLWHRSFAPTRSALPPRSGGGIIMEGEDINSNGPQRRFSPDRRSERTRLFSGAIRLPSSL